MKKKDRIPLKGGAEWDALTKARKYYVYLQSAGVVKSIKKQYNKRLRKKQKQFDKSMIEYRDGDNTWILKNFWTIWKHALGSFDEEDGYNAENENHISYIRTFIVVSNLLCAYVIMINIIVGWF